MDKSKLLICLGRIKKEKKIHAARRDIPSYDDFHQHYSQTSFPLFNVGNDLDLVSTTSL